MCDILASSGMRATGWAIRITPLPVLLALLGCDPGFCVDGLDLGRSYRVTVLEPADANSQYGIQLANGRDFGTEVDRTLSCGAGFDVAAGEVFLVEPVSKADVNGCWGRVAIPTDVPGVQLLGESDRRAAAGFLMATPILRAELATGCSGDWELIFIWTRGNPVAAPVPGDYPPVVLERLFTARDFTDLQSCLLPSSGLASHGYCADYFVVKLDKS